MPWLMILLTVFYFTSILKFLLRFILRVNWFGSITHLDYEHCDRLVLGAPSLPPTAHPQLPPSANGSLTRPSLGRPALGGPAHGGPSHGGPAHGGPSHSGPANSRPPIGGPAQGITSSRNDLPPAVPTSSRPSFRGIYITCIKSMMSLSMFTCLCVDSIADGCRSNVFVSFLVLL